DAIVRPAVAFRSAAREVPVALVAELVDAAAIVLVDPTRLARGSRLPSSAAFRLTRIAIVGPRAPLARPRPAIFVRGSALAAPARGLTPAALTGPPVAIPVTRSVRSLAVMLRLAIVRLAAPALALVPFALGLWPSLGGAA